MIFIYLAGLVLSLISTSLFAGSISFPIIDEHFSKKPAADLVYQGDRIDAYEAFEILKSGVDLSKLNPYQSHLWQDTKHNLDIGVSTETEVEFSEYKRSPTEFFRAIVKNKLGDRLVLTASLENHANIIRANLLRKLGYKVAIPLYQKSIKVNFNSSLEKEKFLESIGEQTLTKRSRWIEENSNETQLSLKNITLEPAKLENVNLALPVMSRSRQEERRVFRSLLAVYALTDFPQSINAIDWKVGRVFNNFLSFSHPYANQFQDVTIDDIKWLYHRLTKLSRNDIRQSVGTAGYPNDITTLVIEKLLSRINSLGQHLGETASFVVRRDLSFGNIKNGELIEDKYENYVVKFFKDEAKSPYEFNQLFRLFKTQTTYTALSKVLDKAIEKIVPGIRVSDAALDIQEQISDYKLNNLKPDGSLPINQFSYPTAHVNTSVKRSIVFGNHMGNTAPIQLVDSVTADANLGIYSMITGVSTDVMPSVSASVGLSRTYSHVRAMPDLETATKQSIRKAIVPNLLKNLGAIIKSEFVCSLIDTVNVEESEINGEKVIYLKYDTEVDGAKKEAILKRSELIASGVSEDIILLVPINKIEACEIEVNEKKEENLETFLKEFALNETFIISDSINVVGSANATIPLNTYLNQQFSMSIGGDAARGFIRAVNIRKKDDHLEISIQKQKNKSKSVSVGLSYFIEILKGTKRWLSGEQKTQIYKVPTEGISEDQQDIVLKTLRQLFVSNKTSILKENYNPIELNHDVEGRLKTLKLLWYKSDSLYMDHFVDITLPESEYPNLELEQRKKSLFSTSSIRRNGKNFVGFFNSILNKFSSFLSLGQSSTDPGQTIKGSSKSRYYISESDVSKNQQIKLTTKVDYVWKGWSANSKKLNHIFNFIETLFSKTQLNYHINRDKFNYQGLLRGYEVKSTIIIYPNFLEKFKTEILNSSKQKAISIMKDLYDLKKWNKYCARKKRISKSRFKRKFCTPRAARTLLKIRKMGLPENKVQQVKTFNKIVLTLLEGFNRQKVINWIGKENFFASTRVTGFLEKSEKGYIDYISNSYGHYNPEYGTGIFDQISSVLGLTPYELRALNYTPGM